MSGHDRGDFSKEPYISITPSDENVLGGITPGTETKKHNGLYSRADIVKDIEDIAAQLEAQEATTTLEDYQYWAESNWKTIHGTYDSVVRFGDKLKEEFAETVEARDDFYAKQGDDEFKAYSSELGDLLWCTSALASNSGASLDTGARIYLHKFALGTQIIRGNQAFPPQWHESVASTSTQWNKVTIKDIDKIIEDGFEPAPSATMNIFEEDSDLPEWENYAHLRANFGGIVLASAITLADIQYGRRDISGVQANILVSEGFFDSSAMRMSEIAIAGLMEIAYLSKNELGSSLQNVISENVTKIEDRIKRGLVDKADGERHE